ncbi:hypothetical protein ACFV7Q_33600 [Streptomyces sp. NPDC059851]
MHQYEWKPADYRRGVELFGIVILATAAALFAAGAIAATSVILAHAIT